MKYLKFLILVFAHALLLTACQHPGGTSIRSFIPGSYVSCAEGQFSVACDTLLVQLMDAGSNAYRIYRNTVFRRIENGKLMKKEYRNEQWTAIFDEKTRSMLESKKGKVISIYPDSGLIVIGSREYRKLEKE